MSPSRTFILRPVATSLLMVGILLAGAVGYLQLPVSALPEVDYPIIQVITFYPGASPDVMASSVTAPLERQFGQVPGLQQMTSTSSDGSSVITLQFNLSLNIDVAEQEVQQSINASGTFLPADLPIPPIYAKTNPADTPILTLALTSRDMPLSKVEDLADTRLAPKISQLPGVGLVSISGGQKPAVRIQANPTAMASYGLNLEDLRTALVAANVNQAKGNFDGAHQSYQIGANDQLLSSADYRPLIIAYRNGAPVKLTDVAGVVDDAENIRQAAWMNETPAVIMNIQRQPGANIISVVDRIKLLLPQLTNTLPASVTVSILTDRTTTIRASVTDVKLELLLTVALVVMVMFLFLRNLSATIIPAAAVPLSLVGTFGVMYLLGYSLNNLTLMALTISTGFVVDDAIVMIENMFRYLEKGASPLRATLKGAKQIGFTVVSISVSLIAAFIPLLFMGGIVGRLFREFSVTLAFAIVVSTVVSLSVTPMICAYFVRSAPSHDATWLDRLVEGTLARMIRFYDRTLTFVLDHNALALIVFVATIALTVGLYIKTPKGYFPQDDTGLIFGGTQASTDVSFGAMEQMQLKAMDVVLGDPAVAGLGSSVGASGFNASVNRGRLFISLKPLDQRGGISTQRVVGRLRDKLNAIPGMRVFMVPAQDLRVGGRQSDSQYQFTLWSPDIDALQKLVPQVMDRVKQVAGVTDVTTDREQGGLQANVTIDRSAAARLGVQVQDIDNALNDAFSQRQISTIYTQRNQYRVILEVSRKYRSDPSDLTHVYVVGAGNTQVPLSEVAHVERSVAPLVVNHQGQFPSVTITYNILPNFPIQNVTGGIEQAVADMHIPDTIHADFAGDVQAFKQSVGAQPLLLLAALVAVYIVLGVLYESLAHPLTIISTLPSAGLGALLALQLFNTELTVIAFIGIILLIGIVKKNGIMMVDFALDGERRRGLSPQAAIHEACLARFRPILMTTMAAALGALPLVIATGPGSELRRPLGITIIGGLLVSQALTLYTTPVIYLLLDKLHRRLGGRSFTFIKRAPGIQPAE